MQMRFTNIWIKLDSIFNMTSWGKEQARLINIIHSFVDKVSAKKTRKVPQDLFHYSKQIKLPLQKDQFFKEFCLDL